MDDETTIASAAGDAQASMMMCTELVESVEPDATHHIKSAEFDRRSWLDLG